MAKPVDYRKKMECRIVIRDRPFGAIALGMFDPITMRYVPLGTHPAHEREKVVRDLKNKMEAEGHIVTFSEMAS